MPPRKDLGKVIKAARKAADEAEEKNIDPENKAGRAERATARRNLSKVTAPDIEQKRTLNAVTEAKRTAAADARKKTAAAKATQKKTAAGKKGTTESDKENEQAGTKTAGTKETSTKKAGVKSSTKTDAKRKRDTKEEDGADAEEGAPPQPKKKTRTAAPAPRSKKTINTPPDEILDVFVFGEGGSGELGLGTFKVDGKKPIDVKRPRLNADLKNVVQVACGGMHAVALTADNEILTWGVNDQGALGRDTTWAGGLKDMDDDDDAEDPDDIGLNPYESTPAKAILPEGITWVQVAASDSASFALTDEGYVWGWGTFRVS